MELPFHFPISLHWSGQTLPLHGIFEALGLFIGFRYYLYLKRNTTDTISTPNRWAIVAGATIGAFIGARILGSLEHVRAWLDAPSPLLYFYGNKTLVGGLLGGLWGVEGVKKIIGEKQRSGDLFVFPLLLGMMIGRVGCFTAGLAEETYGLPSRLPWAIDFGDGITRHPVTLYEIIFLMGLAFWLRHIRKQYLLDSGALFKLLMIFYLIFRFGLDFIKPHQTYLSALGAIQLACLAGLLYYGRYLVRPKLLLVSKTPAVCP